MSMELKRSIAIYALYGGGQHIKEAHDFIENDKDYTRLTEIVDVEFVERSQVDVVAEKIEFFKKKKERAIAEHHVEVLEIEEAIKNLLVIEHKPEQEEGQ